MQNILEKLKRHTKRTSTEENYFNIWRKFNNFLIRLDRRPDSWEDRISLYGAFLVDNGIQSSTLKSYYSAIKAILREDEVFIDDNKVLLSCLAKACRLVNDKVRTRLPVRKPLLEMILCEVQRRFGGNQPYLEILYKTIFILGYYGLFRIGELAMGSHTVRASDVHIGRNKDKMMFILYSSKTHGFESRPKKIKISVNDAKQREKSYFCPFNISREYLAIRGNYKHDEEPFFVFRDRKPVTPVQVRGVLKKALESINLVPSHYSFHSLRAGRCTDLIFFGQNILQVKLAGRWRSNAVYKYIKD